MSLILNNRALVIKMMNVDEQREGGLLGRHQHFIFRSIGSATVRNILMVLVGL